MADKRPLINDNGTVKELAPPDQIPADVLPSTGGKTFAFFMG